MAPLSVLILFALLCALAGAARVIKRQDEPATISFEGVGGMQTCQPSFIRWNGGQGSIRLGVSSVGAEELVQHSLATVDASKRTYEWASVNVPPGVYRIESFSMTDSSRSESSTFDVQVGSDTSCVPGGVPQSGMPVEVDTSSNTPTSTTGQPPDINNTVLSPSSYSSAETQQTGSPGTLSLHTSQYVITSPSPLPTPHTTNPPPSHLATPAIAGISDKVTKQSSRRTSNGNAPERPLDAVPFYGGKVEVGPPVIFVKPLRSTGTTTGRDSILQRWTPTMAKSWDEPTVEETLSPPSYAP
ncbi:hypothetical protein BKA70DRAFT_1428436 [Coprinopsis sp. MPI-PUGE-AT-0042]|nr:hypothetical protein BKA70DRAFT_1428436 [Coprinopsis sp. MPI-PUGE-AT-0042]